MITAWTNELSHKNTDGEIKWAIKRSSKELSHKIQMDR